MQKGGSVTPPAPIIKTRARRQQNSNRRKHPTKTKASALLTRMAAGLPIAHTLTLRSSPPVTSTPADLRPMRRQLTALEWAANSSV